MCVAIIVPKDVPHVSKDEMLDAQFVNDDGLGIAWVQNKRVYYEKGITVKACMDKIKTIARPYILHFRLATAGGKDMTMCHPFPVDNFAKPKISGWAYEVLFHNGHVTEYKDMLMNLLLSRNMRMPKGPISDTRVCALLAHKVGSDALSLIDHNRFATFKYDGTIATYGSWERHEGRLYSNTNHFWDTRTNRGYVKDYTVFTPKEKEAFAKSDREAQANYELRKKAEAKIDNDPAAIRARNLAATTHVTDVTPKKSGWAEMERVAILTKTNADLELTKQWERDEQRNSEGVESDPHSRVEVFDVTDTNYNLTCSSHLQFVFGCNHCEELNGITNLLNPEGPNIEGRR